ncbi:hypothetical protein OXX80_007179 [Metschnikowia pulcherrima]
MTDSAPRESPESSLHFYSTQIQARHEDQEHKDGKVSQLQRFKNAVGSPKVKAPKPVKVTKPKRKSNKKSGMRQINSISAFVRETLGGIKPPDTQSLLDNFLGDQKKLDAFLSEVEQATAMPHLLSRRPRGQDSGLFSKMEWKDFSEKLRLKFPNLSKNNKNTLKLVSKRLEKLKRHESDLANSQDSNVIWSQASRQPSGDLSREDLIWLYDLDDDALNNENSMDHTENVPDSPLCLTLSQVVDDPSQPAGYGGDSVSKVEPTSKDMTAEARSELDTSSSRSETFSFMSQNTQDTDDIVLNSEADIEPLSKSDYFSLLYSSDSKEESTDSGPAPLQKSISKQPWPPELSATTSLVFATASKSPRKEAVPFMSPEKPSPEKSKNTLIADSLTPSKSQARIAFNTPSCLRIDSSPLIQKQRIDSSPLFQNSPFIKKNTVSQEIGGTEEDVFMSANASFGRQTQGSVLDPSDSESLQFSPLRGKGKIVTRDRIEVAGKVELDPSRSSKVQLTILRQEQHRSDEIIPDSEDDPDAELSIIEITKSDNRNTSVLQVPSSPEFEQVHHSWDNRI